MTMCGCGGEPVIYLPYCNKHMCAQHFIRMFDKRFRKTVRVHSLIKKGDRVAVALSGGKDSTVLLHSLAELKKDLPFELIAITIDEGMAEHRPDTMRVAAAECEKLGVEQHTYSFKQMTGKTITELVGETNGLPCSMCGVIRRYVMNKAARELGATKVALGHNLDDLAQTVLMNIMRSEPERLARFGEPADGRFVRRIRPLMLTPEKEDAVYAVLKGIDIVKGRCPFAHTAFRNTARRILNETEEQYPGTKFKVVNSFLQIESALREKYSNGAEFSSCSTCGEPCGKDGQCMFCRIMTPLKAGNRKETKKKTEKARKAGLSRHFG